MPSPVRHSVPRDCFPREIKRLIAESAAPSDIARLARSSSAWQDPAEEALWQTVNIGGHKIGQVTTNSAGDESVGSFWRDCLDALDVRPARKRFVRRLRGPSTDRSVDVILTFLDRFRDQLVAIEQTPLPDGLLEDSDGAAFARAIDCARLMPHLTTLTIHLRHEWEAELAKALRSTPNLVNLALTVSVTDFASTSFRARPPLRLPKLRCLSVESIRWEQGVEMIQDGAPALSTLILGHNNSAFPVWRDGGPGNFTHLWTKRSLRELVICQRLLAENPSGPHR